MDCYIGVFICFQVLLYFVQKGKRSGDKGCVVCKESGHDQVETVCGHYICCKI